MRNKLWILVSLLLIASLALAACGKSPAAEAPAEEPAAEAPAEEAPAEEPAAEEAPTEAPGGGSARRSYRSACRRSGPGRRRSDPDHLGRRRFRPPCWTLSADFAAENGINVVVVQKGFDDLRNDYKVAAPTGEGPDILLGAHDWLGEYNASGLLAEVSLGDEAELFAPNAVDALRLHRRQAVRPARPPARTLPSTTTPSCPEPPATWDEVKELRANSRRLATSTASWFEQRPLSLLSRSSSFGGYVFGQDESGAWNPEDVGLNSEGTLAAFEWLDGMYKDGLLDPGANIDSGLLLSAYQNGDAAVIIERPVGAGRLP